ncbi:MAG: hypothetical protein M3N31_00315 [Actinomycetota bacterium]|nr:hypothetical protein [Actinomycetota bacterium]
MIRLDERERRVSLWASALAAATWVALLVLFGFTGRAAVLAAIGLALAGLLALAARSGSRVLTGLAAVVLGYGPWGAAFILGLPYVVLAGWLFFRGSKARALQRQQTAGERGGREAEEGGDKPTRPSRRTRPERARPAAGPRPNKRYTPPQRRRS